MNDEAGARPDYRPAVALFLFGALIYAWPWLSGSVTIPWDAKGHFYPQLRFLARSLHNGELPFWAPQVFSGTPQIADPQSLVFSPPFVLLALLNPEPGFQAADATIFAMLVAGGLALMGFFRDRGWHPAGALVCAFAFAFGGSNAWRLQHLLQVVSLCWFAITLFLLARALDRTSLRWGILSGIAAAFMMAGRDHVAWLCIFPLTAYALVHVFVHVRGGGRLSGIIRPLAGGAAAGIFLLAVPVILTLAFALDSNRAEITYARSVAGSLHPAGLASFVSANIFGQYLQLDNYWGPTLKALWGETGIGISRNMLAIYMGAIPVLAVAALGIVRGGLLRREIAFFTLSALFFLLYALGKFTPFYALFYHVPGADLFRRPADATFPLGAMLAIVSGYLVHLFLQGDLAASRSMRIAEAVFVILLLVLCGWLAVSKNRFPAYAPWLALSAVTIALAAVSLWLAGRWRRSPFVAMLLVAVMMTADLRVNNRPNPSTGEPPRNYAILQPGHANETIAFLRAEQQKAISAGNRQRVELTGLGFSWPNMPLLHNIEHWLGYNPLHLRWYTVATGAHDGVAEPSQRYYSKLFWTYASPMADMLGIRYVVTSVPVQQINKPYQPGDLRFLRRVREGYLYANPGALPRALVATQAIKADFAAMIESGKWPQADFQNTILLEEVPANARKERRPGTARIVSYRNMSVVIEADAPDGGWLVLHDAWQPWWRVSVNGRSAKLLRANVTFRAVALPPGKHTVRFSFHPVRGAIGQLLGQR